MAQGKRYHWLVLTLGMILCAAACSARTAIADDVLSPLVATPIAAPNPVLGADDKTHLVYEIVLMNMGSTTVGLDKIETLDAIGGVSLSTLERKALAQMFRLNGGAKGTELPVGGSGVMFMDMTLDKDATIPKTLKHRFKIAVATTPSPDRGSDRDPAAELPQEITFVGDPLDVGAPAVVISPPLN
jgi:hypothetical protein